MHRLKQETICGIHKNLVSRSNSVYILSKSNDQSINRPHSESKTINQSVWIEICNLPAAVRKQKRKPRSRAREREREKGDSAARLISDSSSPHMKIEIMLLRPCDSFSTCQFSRISFYSKFQKYYLFFLNWI